MQSLLSFWAKLGKATWPEEYHPVLCHLIDVGQVARRLWGDVFRRQVKQRVTRQLGLLEEMYAGKWLAFWIAAHDIGKLSPCFQHRGPNTDELRKRLAGFDFPCVDRKHGDISTKVLADELKQSNNWAPIADAVARNVAVAVGGHHGIFPTNWIEMPGPLGNEKWFAARRQLLKLLAQLFGVPDLAAPKPVPSDDQSVWMYLAGLTSVADWIGSNVEFFPPVGNAAFVDANFDVDAYFKEAGGKATKALETLGWLGRGDSTASINFSELFPFITNQRPLQKAVTEIVERTTEPALLIVEAPMGEGKTEAGWFAAASWDRRGGQGAYVALPTMATSNQMFGRVGEFLKNGPGKKNLMLQHGKAALNEKFDELKYKAQTYDEEANPSAVVAEGWFAANKKHGLLAPYGVGTIDQALLAVLQTKHVFVRLFGLAGKCVILDEVHAYDAYMTTLMERLLRWLAALGCPVVLLSATLPKEKRLALLRAYAGDEVNESEDKPYPRVTSVTVGGPATVEHVDADPDRAKTVKLGWVAEHELIGRLQAALANGGCAAVIRNTVGLAQETYRGLRDGLKDAGITVELFHARFPFGRRMQIENEVLNRYGKDGGPAERNKRVLVATQVIEQSLDLDFDVMISDVAPVDLVLQRAGRLHRHERGERPAGLREPRVWLIEPDIGVDQVPTFGKSEYVYARYVLLKSHVALKSCDTIRLPEDLEILVEQVYGGVPLVFPTGWEAALQESERKIKEKKDTQQLDAMDVAINDPDQSPLEQQSHQLEEDDPEASKRIHAQTRDAAPSIQLILVYQIDGRDFLDVGGTVLFDETSVPAVERLRQILDNEVTISHPGCLRHYIAKPVPAGWRKCGMLRHHRIVRISSEGKSVAGEFAVLSDPSSGIEFMNNKLCHTQIKKSN